MLTVAFRRDALVVSASISLKPTAPAIAVLLQLALVCDWDRAKPPATLTTIVRVAALMSNEIGMNRPGAGGLREVQGDGLAGPGLRQRRGQLDPWLVPTLMT